MKTYKRILFLLILFSTQLVHASDLDTLKQNLKDFYLLDVVSDGEIEQLLDKMDDEYGFSDIEYTMHRRSNWQPRVHLKRINILATAYECEQSRYYKSDSLARYIVGGLNFWSYNNFYSDNWWYQEIGIPQSLGPTLVICESIIPDSTMVRSLKVMDKARIYLTGQNKIWLSGNVFMRELVRGNVALIDTSAQVIKSIMVPSEPYKEGIQPDFSFHQHGPQPQFGNYGLHFVEDMVMWISIFNNTNIAFSQQKVELMRNLIFQGQQKVVYKGNYDILAVGRQIFPEMVDGEKYRGTMSKADLFHNLEYKFNLFDGQENPSNAPNGYTHFRNSDYSVYRTDSFYSSVRMSSQRVIGAEAGNGENLLGYHLGDGANLLYRRGDEYHEIYPIWNWKKLPGTTTVQDSAKLPVLSWGGYKNKAHFVGGLEGVNVGISALKFRRDGLQANKSYFFINNQVYAMGSGISSNRNFEVVTSVNQCYQRGAFSTDISNAGRTWVWHDSIAYVSLCEQQAFHVSQRVQTGCWQQVLAWQTDTLISENVFSLEVNHGLKPRNGKYAYVSVVGVAEREVKHLAKHGLCEIIAHSEKLHALRLDQGNTIAICAFEPCKLELEEGETLIIKTPALLTMTRTGKGWSIDAVDPTQQLNALSFEIEGEYTTLAGSFYSTTDDGFTQFTIAMPWSQYEKGEKRSVELLKR